MSKVEFKPISHKERKDFIRGLLELIKLGDGVEKYNKIADYREDFLKSHMKGTVNLDEMESTAADELFNALEGKMDFHMGLRTLLKSNIPPSSESQPTPKTES